MSADATPMEIEIALSKSDLITLARYQVDHSSQMHRRVQRLRWGYVAGFALFGLGFYTTFPDEYRPIGFGFGFLAVMAAIFYPLIHRWRVQRYIVQAVQKQSRPESFFVRKLCITAEGWEEETEHATIAVKWRMVDKVDVTPSHTFVSIGGVYSVVIPKSSVKTGNYDEFVASLRSYYVNRTLLKY